MHLLGSCGRVSMRPEHVSGFLAEKKVHYQLTVVNVRHCEARKFPLLSWVIELCDVQELHSNGERLLTVDVDDAWKRGGSQELLRHYPGFSVQGNPYLSFKAPTLPLLSGLIEVRKRSHSKVDLESHRYSITALCTAVADFFRSLVKLNAPLHRDQSLLTTQPRPNHACPFMFQLSSILFISDLASSHVSLFFLAHSI
jgi:hypothetical protein